MVPKLQSCIDSMQGVDHSHIINGNGNTLIDIFKGKRWNRNYKLRIENDNNRLEKT